MARFIDSHTMITNKYYYICYYVVPNNSRPAYSVRYNTELQHKDSTHTQSTMTHDHQITCRPATVLNITYSGVQTDAFLNGGN